jgi:Asp-tRNA(Asn)/Glu-tRNA(Gln) amidotransferase A subunit family amidase
MYADPTLVPHDSAGRPNMRNLGGGRGGRGRGAGAGDSIPGDAAAGRGRGAGDGDSGGGKYNMETYLRERGDANIRRYRDLQKANFWDDPHFGNRRPGLISGDSARTLSLANALQDRFAIQTIVFATFAQHDLDAVIYPSGNVPPPILTNPDEGGRNDRPSGVWTLINSRGFPAMTVPAGFTTHVYDRVRITPRDTTQRDSTRMTGPIPARLPVGIDFLGLPFGEPTLLRIASAYEAKTKHRMPPPGFGPLPARASSQQR